MRRLRLSCATLAAAVVLPMSLPAALAAGPAGATPGGSAASYPPVECAALDLADEAAVDARAATADDVFAGQVLGPQGAAGAAAQQWSVVVTQPFTGDLVAGAPTSVVVDTDDGVAAPLTAGATYLFFTRDRPRGIVADGCEGVVALPSGLTPELATTLQSYLASPSQDATPVPGVHFEDPEDVPGDPPTLGRILASGAAIALVGLLGLIAVAFAGRRRAH